jgi:tripartite-type tricarboxylate transporter receptor subunit TctC
LASGWGCGLASRWWSKIGSAPAAILVSPNAIAISPSLQKYAGYDPVKDFAPIARLVIAPFVFVFKAIPRTGAS